MASFLFQRAQLSGKCPPSLLLADAVDEDGFAEDLLKVLDEQGTMHRRDDDDCEVAAVFRVFSSPGLLTRLFCSRFIVYHHHLPSGFFLRPEAQVAAEFSKILAVSVRRIEKARG